MPSFFPAPGVGAIEELIAGLIPAGARVARGQVDDPEANAAGVFAEYVTENDELAAVAFADVDAVDVLGGAIKGVELEAVAEASENAEVLDDAVEGFHELASLFAQCLNTDFTEHVRLRDVHRAPGALSDEMKVLSREPKGRRAYRVDVPEFGAGNVILYLA